jgi:hypothetical protein
MKSVRVAEQPGLYGLLSVRAFNFKDFYLILCPGQVLYDQLLLNSPRTGR